MTATLKRPRSNNRTRICLMKCSTLRISLILLGIMKLAPASGFLVRPQIYGKTLMRNTESLKVSNVATIYSINDTATSLIGDTRSKQIDAAIAAGDRMMPSRKLTTDASSYNDAQLAYGAEAQKRRKMEESLRHHGIISPGQRYATSVKEKPVINVTPPKRGRGRPRKNAAPIVMEQKVEKPSKTKRRVVEFSSGSSSQKKETSAYSKKKSKQEIPSLQKIYYTELLSQKEEYELGMKVQFLMKCEEVHQGLTLRDGRIPSLAEWASACGFKEFDDLVCSPNYIESTLEASIRPQSQSSSFEFDESAQAFFVGNGLVKDSGVGRGKGRAKQPPATFLPDFFNATKSNNTAAESHTPVNRGTPVDFVDMMLDAKNAKQRMVECNMRLVLSIARRYTNVGVNVQDLVQEGSIGLMRAVEKFVPSKGFKFSTYASWWIQQAVFRSIAYHSRTIRLPVHVHNFLNRVRRVRSTLQVELARSPTNEEVAAAMNMTTKKFSKLINLTRRTISLEMPKYQNNPKDLGHESEASLGDTIDSSSAIKDDTSPEQSVDQGLFLHDLHDMLQILGEEERTVICLRYGLEDGLTRTVTSVAYQLRQSKAWVRSQECRALRKLRRPWYEKILREHQKSLVGR